MNHLFPCYIVRQGDGFLSSRHKSMPGSSFYISLSSSYRGFPTRKWQVYLFLNTTSLWSVIFRKWQTAAHSQHHSAGVSIHRNNPARRCRKKPLFLFAPADFMVYPPAKAFFHPIVGTSFISDSSFYTVSVVSEYSISTRWFYQMRRSVTRL